METCKHGSGAGSRKPTAEMRQGAECRAYERYLKMVNAHKQLPEYSNAMGVLMLLKGDYEHAEEYLKAAAEAGLEAAGQNLEELATKRTNAAEIEKKNKNRDK